MYFKSLTINNLFSYHGSCSFDLTPPDESERNIVIIQGRNGDGKTSFLNSIKILFAGVNEDIRRTVQRKRIPNRRQYVCGIENEWWGILNQQARLTGGGVLSCGVQAIWESDDGEVSAERKWLIDYEKNDYQEEVIVSTPFLGVLTGKDAEDYLERCLPRSYIPFFFFDGEEVQSLAEANDNEVIAKMEQLLNIRPLENIQERLKELTSDWRRNAMSTEERRELTRQENLRRSKESDLAIIVQQKLLYQTEIGEIEDHLNKIARHLKILRGSPDQESEINIKAQIKLKEELRQQHMAEIGEAFQRDAFLRVTPGLVEKALKTTEILSKQEQGTQLEMLNSLKQELPEIFTRPPYPSPRLESQQVEFYQKRIIRALEYFDIPENNGAVFNIDGNRVRLLSGLLSSYQGLHKPHQNLQKILKNAYELAQEITRLEHQLKDAGDMSNKQRAEHARLSNEEESYKDNLLTLKDKLRDHEKQQLAIGIELTKIEKEISRLENTVRQADDSERQLKFAERLRSALNEVKERLKRQKRAELEESYNRHLRQLLDSNSLIAQVKINEHFEITYLDAQQNKIGMSTVSAGMKQLSATALLWGLKEISARELPLIIDTPMGRIDRQHQDNLLLKYYPKIGRQVILLPTDSELDERKRALLKPYIYKEFHLSNPHGTQTEITERTI